MAFHLFIVEGKARIPSWHIRKKKWFRWWRQQLWW